MPSFSIQSANLVQVGPIVEVLISPPQALVQVLRAANQAVPAPVRLMAMVDTGASGTVLTPAVLAQLGLSPVGVSTMSTPSTTSPVQARLFNIDLTFVPNNVIDSPFVHGRNGGANHYGHDCKADRALQMKSNGWISGRWVHKTGRSKAVIGGLVMVIGPPNAMTRCPASPHLRYERVALAGGKIRERRLLRKAILNSPYEYPVRHWELDAQGQATRRVIESRRVAEFVTPIPKPRKRKGGGEQAHLVYGEGKEISTAEQQYDINAIINDVVDALKKRKSPPLDFVVVDEAQDMGTAPRCSAFVSRCAWLACQ